MEEVGKSFYFLCLRQGVIDFSLSIKNIDILTKFFAFKTRPKLLRPEKTYLIPKMKKKGEKRGTIRGFHYKREI